MNGSIGNTSGGPVTAPPGARPAEAVPPAVHCTKCGLALPPGLLNQGRAAPCPGCGAELMVAAFPALWRPPGPGKTGEVLLAQDEANCFYHPNKRAVVPCDHCGRFLCALCDIQMGGHHLCPNCVEPGQGPGKQSDLDTTRTLYDSLALVLAVTPLVVTPLISLFLAIRYWSAPTSLLPRTRARWVLAIVLAVAQIVFWCWLFFW